MRVKCPALAFLFRIRGGEQRFWVRNIVSGSPRPTTNSRVRRFLTERILLPVFVFATRAAESSLLLFRGVPAVISGAFAGHQSLSAIIRVKPSGRIPYIYIYIIHGNRKNKQRLNRKFKTVHLYCPAVFPPPLHPLQPSISGAEKSYERRSPLFRAALRRYPDKNYHLVVILSSRERKVLAFYLVYR